MVRVQAMEETEAGQSGRGALHIVVVNHDVAKHLRRVEVLKEAPAPRLLASRVSSCGTRVNSELSVSREMMSLKSE